jgi:ankyrin repeat protein
MRVAAEIQQALLPKPLSGFRFVEAAIITEIAEQKQIYASGGTVHQETRLFNGQTGEIRTMRTKEDAQDYRYFPEPDLPPITITPEMIAALKGNREIGEMLIAKGADVNTRLKKGDSGRGKLSHRLATPFLMASKTADLPLMKLLVELGADPSMPNADGATPMMAAAGLGCLAPDEEAGTEGECLEAAKYLLALGANINAVDRNGETAMHGAAYKSLPKVIHFLTENGAKIETWNTTNRWGWTPLRIAEGYRPGNFKPSFETIAALGEVMSAAGINLSTPVASGLNAPESYPPDGSKKPTP